MRGARTSSKVTSPGAWVVKLAWLKCRGSTVVSGCGQQLQGRRGHSAGFKGHRPQTGSGKGVLATVQGSEVQHPPLQKGQRSPACRGQPQRLPGTGAAGPPKRTPSLARGCKLARPLGPGFKTCRAGRNPHAPAAAPSPWPSLSVLTLRLRAAAHARQAGRTLFLLCPR